MSRFVYLLKNSENIYKIGVSKDVDKRIKQLQTGYSDDIVLVDKFLSEYPFKIETYLHHRYQVENVKGEWFYLTNEDVNNFKQHCLQLEKNFKCLDECGNPFF